MSSSPDPSPRPSLLLVTDLTYPARGRRYGDEDVWLAARLRQDLDVAMCSPLDAVALMDPFDVVLLRNSGPVIHHREAHEAFRHAVRTRGTTLVNPLEGKGDMAGKGYLLDLAADGWPVIPTVARHEDLHLLPPADTYVVKPLLGADSHGLQVLAAADLPGTALVDMLVQPRVDFVHEVSLVFVGRRFCYALRAPDPARRWDLEPFEPSEEDLDFAQAFVDWNDLDVGVQRVDACRLPDGSLLLVELEDLNPYLSLDLLDEATREAFCVALVDTLHTAVAAAGGA